MSRPTVDCCSACLRYSTLLGLLSERIEHSLSSRQRVSGLLALEEGALIAALGADIKHSLYTQLEQCSASSLKQPCQELGLFALCRHSAQYPLELHDLPDQPAVLYGRGEVVRLGEISDQSVAVVGARRATRYGLEVAELLGLELAAAGLVTISGLAFGVDAAAHRGALKGGGITVAVLASGVDRPYPVRNTGLYQEIAEEGLLLSEMPLGFKPRRWTFPARNRTIAALSKMTVVVEAGEHSGSLYTAGFARDMGRAVGAVPGPINSLLSVGTNKLISDGCCVVTSTQEILDELYGVGARTVPSSRPAKLDSELEQILIDIESGCDSVDSLCRDGRSLSRVLSTLSELKLLGLIYRADDGSYASRECARR